MSPRRRPAPYRGACAEGTVGDFELSGDELRAVVRYVLAAASAARIAELRAGDDREIGTTSFAR